MIKLIIFDFGGVIGCESDDWSGTFSKISELTGLDSTKLDETFSKHWLRLKVGQESMTDFWDEVASKSPKSVDPAVLRTTYNTSVGADIQMLALVKKLTNNFRVVILTNESDDGGQAKVKKFKLNELVSKVYNSAEMGVGKPDKEAFEIILKEQGISPSEVLFIDNQENNCEAAKTVGINTILFKNLKQLKADLTNFLSH